MQAESREEYANRVALKASEFIWALTHGDRDKAAQLLKELEAMEPRRYPS